MKEREQSRVLNNIVSPYGLAMISYAFFLFACLIPPSVYTHYMKEPDLMFLDPATILFYTLCVVSFVVGVWTVSWLYPSSLAYREIRTRISPALFLLVPLTFGVAATVGSIFLLINHNPTLILMLLSQQGGDLKHTVAFDTEGNFTLAPLMVIGIIWWSIWRYFDLRLQRWQKQLVKFSVFTAVFSVIVSSTLILSRDRLMLIVGGIAIIFWVRKTINNEVSFKFALRSSLAIVIGIPLLFFTYSFLRGSDSWDDQVYQLIGYTAASYNRLAAIVNGSLRYQFAGRGVYLSGFIAYDHILNRFLPLSRFMNWPDRLEVWGAEFGAISRAGLDDRMIWSGAFGDIFSDLGWFSSLFLFAYGMLYGVVWRWIKSGMVIGIVLYPCAGFCTLFWFGSNYLLDSQAAFLVVSAVLLVGYEFAFVKLSVKTSTV
jgi:hypothetical protein